MKWSDQAEKAVSRVPFFVRKRVRKSIEEEASRSGAKKVGIEHVQACQQRFLHNMEGEINGFSIETCFGPSGCPNRAVVSDDIVCAIEERLSKRNLKDFLKDRVQGELKFHHELKVSVSDCPNACSQPQIADVGLIGARQPVVTEEMCDGCRTCVDSCVEKAITLLDNNKPAIDYSQCLFCGKCISVCPTHTLTEEIAGYRVLIGGKLGRYPQLARELRNIHTDERVLEKTDQILDYYQKHNQKGKRLGDILNRVGLTALIEDDDVLMVDRVIEAMKKEFGNDRKRIVHSLRVGDHAQDLLRYEDADPRVVMTAAILHDIGIKEAEKKHGSAAGEYQEKEGPPIARRIMEEIGFDADVMEHVLRIVGNHHSARDIDTPEFRIVWDADWLVNMPDEYPGIDEDFFSKKIENIFRTKIGKKRAYDLWF